MHRFNWLKSESLVGALPPAWNHLVDYDPPLPLGALSNLHFTEGGPYFAKTRDCGYADAWRDELSAMTYSAQPA